MITISACMIVKNEERMLQNCLECLKPAADEIIIVDTGSTDRTREIAARYTDRIYDFPWIDDFAAARNFAFSKAKMDYIYTADADEELDNGNIRKLLELKRLLLPEIEIVQMWYLNVNGQKAAYNSRKELRPKLFKRVRTFEWINPVHETVRLDPIVYDSDIEIRHLAGASHAKRDFATFQKALRRGMRLDKVLHGMYAKELFIAGDTDDFAEAEDFFLQSRQDGSRSPDEQREAACVLARYYRLTGNDAEFFRIVLRETPYGFSSELCTEVGEYFFTKQNFAEALCWYNDGIYETEPIISVYVRGTDSLLRLAECYERCGNTIKAEELRAEAEEWTIPEEV